MRRTFHDESLREWEVYVSGGQPKTEAAARIYFLCLTEQRERPRFVNHEAGDVAEAERKIRELSDGELLKLLEDARPLD